MEIDNLISQNKTGTKLEMCTKLIAIQNSSTQLRKKRKEKKQFQGRHL